MRTGQTAARMLPYTFAYNFSLGRSYFLRFLIWQDTENGRKVIDTSAVKENGFLEQEQETYSKKLKVTPRTIVVLMAVEEEKKDASVAAL